MAYSAVTFLAYSITMPANSEEGRNDARADERANTRHTHPSSSHRLWPALLGRVPALVRARSAARTLHDSPTCYLKSSIERMNREDQVTCESVSVMAHRITVRFAKILLKHDSDDAPSACKLALSLHLVAIDRTRRQLDNRVYACVCMIDRSFPRSIIIS